MSEMEPVLEQPDPSGGARRPSVVGIGASAGGLEALKRFFHAVPRDSGIVWVVVMHLPAGSESHLADLLQPHSAIPVVQVRDTTPLEPDRAYVIPPGHNLTAAESVLRLGPLESARHARAPIDHFFRTLAQSFDGRALAVVLTGIGSDGTLGIREVHARGGFVVVQDPEEAEFDGMPRSAITTGLVDLVLPVAEIPPRIVELEWSYPQVLPAETAEGGAGAVRDEIPSILTQIRARTDRDFSRYKRSTIERRIERRMQLGGIEELGAYLELLRESPREAEVLAHDLLINVTQFFRDPRVFEQLEKEVIPALFEAKGPGHRIRVWSVGCATGEEAYSLGMLLMEEAARRDRPPPVQIFASDLHERSLQYAREGLYPETVAADVSPERLRRFFQEESGGYRIRKELRELVVFAPHNLLRDPPFSHLDLICCRNLLIYLQRDVQDEVIELFHYALHGAGYLLLGTAESLARTDLFRVESKENHLFRKRVGGRSELRLPALPLAPLVPAPLAEGSAALPAEVSASYGSLHQRLVERYAPPSLVVDPEYNVVHLSEGVGRYLQLAGGVPSNNVFKLVREELRMELRAALHLSRERQATSRSRVIPVRLDGEPQGVVLRVSPMASGEAEGLTLVIFDEVGVPSTADEAPQARDDRAARELESELQMTRNRLQALAEEFETSQEEMRASNEELQSANEELRSTLEELETSREELQSINEELQTVNQENRHKVEELGQLSNDLQNLLKVTDIATLFLDRGLRILRFTPRVAELFSIRHTDRGRPLTDLSNKLGSGQLLEDAKRVLETLVPVEREVETEDGEWYLVRTLPYRTVEDRIAGVVITLVDVSGVKSAEKALRESEERFRRFGDASSDVLWIRDAETLQWEYLSPGFESVYGVDRGPVLEGNDLRGWAELIVPEDREMAIAFIERVRAGERVSFEYRVQRPDGQLRWLRDTDFPIRDVKGGVRRIGGIGQDITEQKRIEAEARELNETLEHRVEERTREVLEQEERFGTLVDTAALTVWTADAQGQMQEDSPSWRAFTGQSREERLGEGWTNAVHPEDRAIATDQWFRSVAAATPVNAEFRIWYEPGGSWRWTNFRAVPMRDEGGAVRGWIGMNIDIDERKRAEKARADALRQLVTAEEEERRRIARELHDQLGQQLTGLLLGLRAARRAPGTAELEQRLVELERLTGDIAREMQHLALELRPAALDTLGLVAALQSHLEEWAERHGIESDFHAQGMQGIRLPHEAETTLYRVVQEGLTNVVKHAGARRVSLMVEYRDGTARVVLEDDGEGFDVEPTLAAPAKAKRLGVRGMRERLALFGGELEIESAPGRGTTLYARLPAALLETPASDGTGE